MEEEASVEGGQSKRVPLVAPAAWTQVKQLTGHSLIEQLELKCHAIPKELSRHLHLFQFPRPEVVPASCLLWPLLRLSNAIVKLLPPCKRTHRNDDPGRFFEAHVVMVGFPRLGFFATMLVPMQLYVCWVIPHNKCKGFVLVTIALNM